MDYRNVDVRVLQKDGKTIEPIQGERWTLRVYETWPDYGHHSDFIEELGEQIYAPPPRGSTRLIPQGGDGRVNRCNWPMLC